MNVDINVNKQRQRKKSSHSSVQSNREESKSSDIP